MERVQKLQKAKLYLDMLACSMDPTTNEFVEDEVLQKSEVKNLFKYVSRIIEELLWNNGEVVNVTKPIDFQASRLNKTAVSLSKEPIQLSTLVMRINRQVDVTSMRRLGPSKISRWLVENGYLANEKIRVEKQITQLTTTDISEDFGIVIGEKVNVKTGEIKPQIFLTQKAQEYIVDHLETILGEDDDCNNSDKTVDTKCSMRGKPWSKQEEQRLVMEFSEHELSISEIAEMHGRAEQGIRIRLKKLGVITG